MYEQTFDDVVVMSEVRSPHAAGFVHMSETSFHSFTALAEQSLPAISTYASPVGIDRSFLFLQPLPLPSSPVRL